MLNIFLVTSCIKSFNNTISFEDRYAQTLNTFESIRARTNNSVIIFCDSSIGGLPEDKINEIKINTDHFLDYSKDETAQIINQRGLKSLGESYLLKNSILFAQKNYDLTQTGRMFKLGGRCELLPEFTMDDYKNADGKFVFKKRLPTWMDTSMQNRFGATNLLETRLYSWNLNMTDEYLSILDKNFNLMSQGLDTEHSHFINISKDKLLEFDVLNVGCFVAGYVESYYIRD